MKVESVNISTQKGTIKQPVSEVTVAQEGIVGDAHAGTKNRYVSILSQESIDHFSIETESRKFKPGEFAENITISGLDFEKVSVSDRFRIGQAEFEVTQIGKKCHGDKCAIYTQVGKCVMPKEGIFCKVISNGSIKPGDEVEFIQKDCLNQKK